MLSEIFCIISDFKHFFLFNFDETKKAFEFWKTNVIFVVEILLHEYEIDTEKWRVGPGAAGKPRDTHGDGDGRTDELTRTEGHRWK